MFEIREREGTGRPGKGSGGGEPGRGECSSGDLQYQICSRFLKLTSEQLYQRELDLMQQTTQLLERVGDCFNQKDVSTTQESLTLDPNYEEEEPFGSPSRSRLLRKSQSNQSLRRSEWGVTQALWEVGKNCSEKTVRVLGNLANQFRRLKEKAGGWERTLREFKKLQKQHAATQEELLLLRKRVTELQQLNLTLGEEGVALRRKLKEMGETHKSGTLALSKSSDDLRALGGGDKLKKYLQNKEMHIFKKEKEIKGIQERMQRAIEGIVDANSCDKCCQLVRRLKDSIINYRTFLDEQSKLAEKIYEQSKRLFS